MSQRSVILQTVALFNFFLWREETVHLNFYLSISEMVGARVFFVIQRWFVIGDRRLTSWGLICGDQSQMALVRGKTERSCLK